MLEDQYERFRRTYLEKILKQSPVKIKNMIIQYALSRVYYIFHEGRFGILSACRIDNSRKQNFEAMFNLSEEIRNLGFYFIPVCHYYHGIGDMALFIANMESDQVKEVAEELNLGSFVWGERGYWEYWESPYEECIYSGKDLKIIDIIEQIVIYNRIKKKTKNLKIQLKGIRLKHRKLDKHLEKTVQGLKSKIADYEKLMGELLGIE